MLPILPALILLLLQGHSNLERLAREGRLPMGLDAIYRDVDQPELARSMASDSVFASLLASRDAQLSSILSVLLGPSKPQEPSRSVAPSEEPRAATPSVKFEALHPGFAKGSRTRDGPSRIA